MANIITLTLANPVRVTTASGEAQFMDPVSGALLENSYKKQGLDLVEGATVTLAAKFEKTDTFLVAYTVPAHSDSETGDRIPALMTGLVLRRASWNKVLKAGVPVADEA